MAQEIAKALQELSNAIENNKSVESVVIQIKLKKAETEQGSKRKQIAFNGTDGAKAPPISPLYYRLSKKSTKQVKGDYIMITKKNDKEYSISETKTYWLVSSKNDLLTVEYKVSKDICKDESELQAYIEKEEIF